MSEDKLNHARCSIDDGWKEFERSGDISNAAENTLASASWLLGEVMQLKADKEELVESIVMMIASISYEVGIDKILSDGEFEKICDLLNRSKS